MALADLGHQSLAGSLLLGLGALAILAAVLVLVPRLRPQVRVDRGGLVGMLLLAVFAAVMFVPGFHYGLADKDPGGYVAHAMGIARTGNYEFKDPAVGKIPDLQYISPGARFNGFWVSSAKPGWIVPQFYHLWPSLMAVSYEAFGERGLAETAPLCALLAILAVALALRRAVASSVLARAPRGSATGRRAGRRRAAGQQHDGGLAGQGSLVRGLRPDALRRRTARPGHHHLDRLATGRRHRRTTWSASDSWIAATGCCRC